jgi:hypothetical protein
MKNALFIGLVICLIFMLILPAVTGISSASYSLNNADASLIIGGEKEALCFGAGLIFGFALATGNGLAAFSAFLYLLGNCV